MLDVVVLMSGASPVTVTDSCSVEIVIWTFTVTCCPTSSSSAVRVTVENPGSTAVILKTPARAATRNVPRSPVTASNVLPEASCTAVIVTPGRTAPVESVTVR